MEFIIYILTGINVIILIFILFKIHYIEIKADNALHFSSSLRERIIYASNIAHKANVNISRITGKFNELHLDSEKDEYEYEYEDDEGLEDTKINKSKKRKK